MKKLLVALFTLFSFVTVASATDVSTVPKVKQTKLGQYFTAQEAADFVAHNASKSLFLDIRTPAEVTFLGMAQPADANVPYMVEPPFQQWDAAKSSFSTRSRFLLKVEGSQTGSSTDRPTNQRNSRL